MKISPSDLSLIPWPRSVCSGSEEPVCSTQKITWEGVKTARLQRAVKIFLADQAVCLTLCCESSSSQYPVLGGDEAYLLQTSVEGVRLQAKEEWGILRGLASIAQLKSGCGVAIEDSPRFAWRGLMIDVARHFISVETLKRTLKAMAYYKLNVLHLHLCDDQAFRFPSSTYPLLNADQPSYTSAELRDLVALAADLGIRVVPEIDMPGHVNSWLVAYPEWGSGQASASVRFGGHKACLDVTNPQTLAAVRVLLSEVMEIFPDQYVHIGGDEVNPSWWQESAEIKEYMAQHGLTTTKELHVQFNQTLHTWLDSKNKIMIGWDEVLGENLPLPMTVQSWRGATARDRALAQGADCIISANYYLDFWYPADLYYRFDPGASEASMLTEEDNLCLDQRVDHVKHGLKLILPWRRSEDAPVEEPGQILGGEACLWSELVTDELVDARLWGCMPAIAERFWSGPEMKDVSNMQDRLVASWQGLLQVSQVEMHGAYRKLCTHLQINTNQMPFLEMLEPTKWYSRLLGEEVLNARLAGIEMPNVRPYTADMPLNKLADYLPPESISVWKLERAVDAFVESGESSSLHAFAQSWSETANHSNDVPQGLEELARQLVKSGELLQLILAEKAPSQSEEIVAEICKTRGEYLLANGPALTKLVACLRE